MNNTSLKYIRQSSSTSTSLHIIGLLVSCFSFIILNTQAFQLSIPLSLTSHQRKHSTFYQSSKTLKHSIRLVDENEETERQKTENESTTITNRRNFVSSTIMATLSTVLLTTQHPQPSYADIEGVVTPSFLNNGNDLPDQTNSEEGVTLYTTKSGLKYIELREGNGPSPKYGNFVSISYKAYVKLPEGKSTNSKLQEYDSDSAYLIKHGNGRIIPGLDEGLHTMKVGGKRRIIIPPKLGYVGPGVLGPLPEGPYGRYRLNKLLDEMIEVRGGNVVFDVELRSVVEDEADQGYYDDLSLSPEEFNTLRMNLQKRGKEANTGFDLLDSV